MYIRIYRGGGIDSACMPRRPKAVDMAFYFFHLRNDCDRILDLAGRELDGIEAVRAVAIEEARGRRN